jgi:hypothetical protein
MQMSEVYTRLKTIGLPIAYYQWVVTPNNLMPSLPYLIYKSSDNQNIVSDNKVHATWNYYDIEYYFEKKNTATEKVITDVLETIDIDYTETPEIYIESEQMYMKTYTIKTLNRR